MDPTDRDGISIYLDLKNFKKGRKEMNLAGIKAFARVAKQTIVKHSPEILMAVGGVTFVATVVVACKETVKETDILEEHDFVMADLESDHEDNQLLDDKAYKKSKINAYKHITIQTVKNYTPAVILGGTSLACFFGAFGIMRKRYATLVMAYTALEESFRKYRERVIADKGIDADIYYLTGSKPKEITVKDKNGEKKKVKSLLLPDGTVASPYAFKFGKYNEDGSRNNQWSSEQQTNLSYILGQQDWLNNQLYMRNVFDSNHRVKIRGSVMLNEVRDLLGEVSTPTGSVVGWRYSNGEPGCNGFIDFQLVEAMEPDPETGEDIPCVFINPNVDGMIYDLLGKEEKKPFEPNFSVWGEDTRI